MADLENGTSLATELIREVGLVFTTPALLGVVVAAVFATWLTRGWLARNQIGNAESAKRLFQDRYELEKQSHDALKEAVKKDKELEGKAIAAGPREIREVVLQLGRGKTIHSDIDPATAAKDWGTVTFTAKNPNELRKLAALANTLASGYSTRESSSSGGYDILGTRQATEVSASPSLRLINYTPTVAVGKLPPEQKKNDDKKE